MNKYNWAIVGGGVAGMMWAGTAAERGETVVLLEKMERTGRKLRITGKGRCNLTNVLRGAEFLAHVRGGEGAREWLGDALEAFDSAASVALFERLGVRLVVERGGRVFPESGRAQEVEDALKSWILSLGVEIRTGAEVDEIVVRDGAAVGVQLLGGEIVRSDSVLVATGGVSYPATGSTGDGHAMLDALGHSIVALRPALVPLEVAESLEAVDGLELRQVRVELVVDGAVADERLGEVLFREGSVGGPAVVSLSRQAVDALLSGKKVALRIDLKSGLSVEKLVNRIGRDLEALADVPIKVLLDKLTPRPMHAWVAKGALLSMKNTKTRSLNEQSIRLLAQSLKGVELHVTNYRPFTEAIITAGGVALSEVDPKTRESRLVKNLYIAGELLDIDADTGGYNIQLALSTAYCGPKQQ